MFKVSKEAVLTISASLAAATYVYYYYGLLWVFLLAGATIVNSAIVVAFLLVLFKLSDKTFHFDLGNLFR